MVEIDGAAPPDGAIDLRRLTAALIARKWWIILPTLATLACGLAFVALVSPRYTAAAQVVLESQESYFTRPDKATSELSTPLIYDPESVQGEAESVKTKELARVVVRKLALLDNVEFNPPRGLFGTLLSLFSRHPSEADEEERVAEAFLKRVTVFPVAKTRILQIEFSSADPKLAADAANMLARAYLDSKEEAKRLATQSASRWLSSRIEELRGKVSDADSKAEAFRAQSGLLGGSGGMTLPSQQLSEIAAQIAAARTTQTQAASKAQMLKQMLREGRLDSAPDIAKDESLRKYAEQRVTLKAQIAEESRTLLPGHPHMKELAGQLAGLEAEIRAAAAKAARGLEDEAELAGAEVANLEAAVARQSKAVATGNGDEVRLRELELDAKTAREQLESYIDKYHEAAAHEVANAEPPNARILSVATPPFEPTFPKKTPTLLLSALVGLFLSIGFVIAKTLLADEPAAPAFARAPAPIQDAPTVRSDRGEDLESVTRELISAAKPGTCLPTLFVGDGAGAALAAALSVARKLSAAGSAVLLDLGVSQPWLSDTFDPIREGGTGEGVLSDVLDGRVKFIDALHRDLSSNVDILPSGPGEVEPEGLGPVLEVLLQSYAFVVMHASDWRSPAAQAAMSRAAALVLCAPNSRLPRAKARMRDALPDIGIPILGLGVEAPVEAARPAGQARRQAAI